MLLPAWAAPSACFVHELVFLCMVAAHHTGVYMDLSNTCCHCVFGVLCRSLRFEDKPDYSFLRRMFRDLFAKEGECIHQLCCATAHTVSQWVPVGLWQQSPTHFQTSSACLCEDTSVGIVASPQQSLTLQICLCILVCACASCAGWNWDYVFDWTILKYQRSNGVERPISSAAAVAAVLPAAGGTAAATAGQQTLAQQQQQQLQPQQLAERSSGQLRQDSAATQAQKQQQQQFRRM